MNWPHLTNSPIVLAVMELKFNSEVEFDFNFLTKNDQEIFELYPEQKKNFEGNIKLPTPAPGKSMAQIDSQQTGYTYTSEDKLRKIVITKDKLAFLHEGTYYGWDDFFSHCKYIIQLYNYLLPEVQINRTSMRFINKFNFEKLDSPLDYLNTFISAKEGVIDFPILNLNYKYVMQIPDTNTKINVIQSVEEKNEEGYSFLFDIDVLDHDSFQYTEATLLDKLQHIRAIKNDTFFKNLTDKSINILK